MWASIYSPAMAPTAKLPSAHSGSFMAPAEASETCDSGETGVLVDRLTKDGLNSPHLDASQLFLDKERGKWRHDLGVCSVGTLAGMALFLFTNAIALRTSSAVLPACAGGLGNLQDNLNLSKMTIAGHRYAFVQMAYDPPGAPLTHIWQVLAMARALKRFSAYPLVVLTNTTQLPDGTALASSFHKLNVQMLPVHEVPMPSGLRWPSSDPRYKFGFWKLQIWRLTQFEKLVWLDTDAIVVRSMDWLFQRSPMWGQRHNWDCNEDDDERKMLCTGLLLVAPSEETYQGLVRFAAKSAGHARVRGDEALIQEYFERDSERPVRLLDSADAAYGKCLGSTPNIPYHSPGSWNMPAFVHKSAVRNECFYFDLAKQQVVLNGEKVNICTYHPLGAFWREMFCDAVKTMGVKTNTTEVFCDDYRWYMKG